jgi:diacylglycerol O-acyltransferase / wax synthase
MPTRLTPLDNSFLRVEGPNSHMHVAWAGLLEPHPKRPRPAVETLRAKVAARLRHLPRFRQRLAFPPLGFGEPFWVDDSDFDVASQVTGLSEGHLPVSRRRFQAMTDAVLSEPLDRARPLWHIYLVPRLEDGRTGVICKLHHAMVDGKSAVEVALLLFDDSADGEEETPDEWSPSKAPTGARLAFDSLVGDATESLRTVRDVALMAGSSGESGLAGTFRRAALAVERDLLRSAPPSHLNVPISPERMLVTYDARMSDIARARRETGATVNDVCLAAVAGALRRLALLRGEHPRALKVMVPVSIREDEQRQALGNRISFAFIDLPVHLRSTHARLEHVQAATSEFKRSGRAAGTDAVLSMLGALPAVLKDRAARVAASPRMYNLTVSNIPGPPSPVYMLGAELREAYPVVPIADGHSLSIGMFSYLDRLFFGVYADPKALPEAETLPRALEASILALARRRRSRSPSYDRPGRERPVKRAKRRVRHGAG